jgi:nicotinamidase-related amidase
MQERVWDRYITAQDRAHIALDPSPRKGGGAAPALVLVDLYRRAFGDIPEPLLESVKTWPNSCGLAGWNALPHIRRLLLEARRLQIPVVHLTGLGEMPGWNRNPRPGRPLVDGEADRVRRRYQIVDEVAPAPNEVVLRKSAPSAFFGTPLAPLLIGLGVDTVVVAGESTSGCVRATVVDAKSYRFRVVIPEECVFDRHEAAHAINLFDMNQKYADVLPLDEVLSYLPSPGSLAAVSGPSVG